MNRNTQTVLSAARHYGRITIQSRSGEQFKIEVVSSPEPRPEFMERMRLHRERMRALGVEGPKTPEGTQRLNQIIAGEE